MTDERDELRFHKLIDEAMAFLHERADDQRDIVSSAYDVLAVLAAGLGPRPHPHGVQHVLADLSAYGRTAAERDYLTMRLLMRLMQSVEAYYTSEYMSERLREGK